MAVLSELNITQPGFMTCAHIVQVKNKAQEGLQMYSCLHHIRPSESVSTHSNQQTHTLTPSPRLIIVSSFLCLPRCLMMTGMARLWETQVPTLMSPCLTPLLLAQVSPHPCPLIYNVPSGWRGRGHRAAGRGEGGGGFIVRFLSPLSLFIYDISSMTRDTAWPQGQRADCSTPVTVTPKAERCGSLADHRTKAPLSITPRESAG